MRGLRFGFVATTLLAQVDASVGGKNGVNLEGYKNIVGSFSQPEFVLCDMQLLRTLPGSEVVNGMAEIAKHAMIADAAMFAFIEANAERALALDPAVIEKLVRDSVRIKAAVVGRDERETGERRTLNFGHTFGHALEKVGRFSHGEAVAIGMALAAAHLRAPGAAGGRSARPDHPAPETAAPSLRGIHRPAAPGGCRPQGQEARR